MCDTMSNACDGVARMGPADLLLVQKVEGRWPLSVHMGLEAYSGAHDPQCRQSTARSRGLSRTLKSSHWFSAQGVAK